MGKGLCFYGTVWDRDCSFLVWERDCAFMVWERDCPFKGKRIVILRGEGLSLKRGEGLSLKRERECPFMVYGRGTVLF